MIDGNDKPDGEPTVTVADLDANNTYWGVKTILKSEQTAESVLVPADCDLAEGKYRWSAKNGRFEPLDSEQVRATPEQTSLEELIYEMARAMEGQNLKVPHKVSKFMRQFELSIDALGAKK